MAAPTDCTFSGIIKVFPSLTIWDPFSQKHWELNLGPLYMNNHWKIAPSFWIIQCGLESSLFQTFVFVAQEKNT